MRINSFLAVLVAGAGALSVAVSVDASPTALITAANPGSAAQIADNYGHPGYIGYDFKVVNPVTVDQLGFYDIKGDGKVGSGLVASHFLSLYLVGDTTPLATATVDRTTTTLDNGFRYASVAPTALIPGDTYELSASIVANDGDFWLYQAQPTVSADFSSVNGGCCSEPSPYIPSFGGGAYVGPNLEYIVPEPGSCALLGLSAAGLLRRSRRR